jgi:hypothetical protein
MAQMSTKHQELPEADRVADAPQAAASWMNLYRGAGVAALITAVLIPVQLAVFMANPFPETVTGWFELLQDNPLAGLVDLDLLLVVDTVLLVVIALALYMALRSASPSITMMATGLWLLAIAMFIASNPALQMLSLSDQFAAATSPDAAIGDGGGRAGHAGELGGHRLPGELCRRADRRDPDRAGHAAK